MKLRSLLRPRQRGSGGAGTRWTSSAAVASLRGPGLPAGAVPLRLGLLCDDVTVEAWEAEAVSCLVASGFATLCLALVGDCADAAPARSRDENLRASALRAILERSRGYAHRHVDLSPQLAGVLTVRGGTAVHAAVADGKLDVILRLGSAAVDDHLLSLPRHGVWTIERTGNTRNAAGPVGFWEILNGELVTGARLCRLTGGDGTGVVLREGCVKTVGFMPGRSLDAISFEAARWPTYAAAELVNGAPELEPLGTWRIPAQPCIPTWFDLGRFLVTTATNLARRAIERGPEEWHVGAVKMSIEAIALGQPLADVRWLPAGPDAWYADPCARMAPDGKIVVLFEEMRIGRNGADIKGRIASAVLDDTGWSVAEPVLDTGSHASYPYLIEAGGKILMTPETGELNELGLYEATSFPQTWRKAGVLLPGIPAIDATVFEHAGKWWILCTTGDSSNETLLAFHADSLAGPWLAHRKNPLKVDVRGARPAGRPFNIGGVLYRPTQDSSRTYGGRIVVQRIRELDPQRWAEEPAFVIEPGPAWPYTRGLHTLSIAGDICIIDAKRILLPGIGQLSRRLRRLRTKRAQIP